MSNVEKPVKTCQKIDAKTVEIANRNDDERRRVVAHRQPCQGLLSSRRTSLDGADELGLQNNHTRFAYYFHNQFTS